VPINLVTQRHQQSLPQRGGDVNEAFQLLSPERRPASPALSDCRGADGENAAPQEPEATAAPSPAPKAAEAKGAAAAATPEPRKPATRGVGRRTRIPAYSSDGSRAGLSDMTNRE
jgi:hypothetical protein